MRYAVISDIHGNLPALQAVVSHLEAQPIDGVIFLGDALGYYAEPDAVIEILQNSVSRREVLVNEQTDQVSLWLPGNHEWLLLEHTDAQGFREDAVVTITASRDKLNDETVRFLKALPTRIDCDLTSGLSATLVHARPSDHVGVTGAGSYLRHAAQVADDAQDFGQICLIGHTHVPRIFFEGTGFMVDQRLWQRIDAYELTDGCFEFGEERLVINPGSVGQPRDGIHHASYGILDAERGRFQFHRVPYDIERAQRAVVQWVGHHLTNIEAINGLAGRLHKGL